MAGLLQNLLAVVQTSGLTANLVLDGLLDAAERVHILGLGTGAVRSVRARAQRDVHVSAHVALLHTSVGDVQRAHDVADGAHIGTGDFGSAVARTLDRLGDDLNQRHTGTVVVDQRVVGAFDTAVGATHVGVLAGVVLDVRALDRHAEHGAVFQLDVQVAVAVGGLVVLRDLVVARHVRVEVVLTGELAPLGDFAVQGQTQLDGVIDGGLVDHRQASRQTEAHRGQLGVRLATELDVGRAEQLGVRGQLHVGFQTEDHIVLLGGIGVLHQFFSHDVVSFLPMLTCPDRQATGS